MNTQKTSCLCRVRALYLCALAVVLGLEATSANAQRDFQMALFQGNDPAFMDLAWVRVGLDPMPAPPRHVIADLGGWYANAGSRLAEVLDTSGIDWSRVEAVYIDEPYWNAVGGDTAGDRNAPCTGDPRVPRLLQVAAQLEYAALVVKQNYSHVRFWVNFSEPEVLWMMDARAGCQQNFYRPYIDVVSMDKYDTDFNGVFPFYDWFINHRTELNQHLALVPGTYYNTTGRTDSDTAVWLQQYFTFAEIQNAKGWRDPKVWAVLAYPGHTPTPVELSMVDHPEAVSLRTAWQQKLAEPKVKKPARPLPAGLLLLLLM